MEPSNVIPRLWEIVRTTQEISPEMTVRDVVEVFQKNPSLLGLPVAYQGKLRGVVNRKAFFLKHLGKPYTMDLYGKKPISVLLEELGVVMDPDLDINTALAKLLEVDPGLEIDSFPVVEGERCIGIVAVADLMMKISSTQAMLLDTLGNLSARIREEISKASKIQQDLLPLPDYEADNISIAAGLITSSEIGGDFYDYFSIGDTSIGFVIADVSGHGVQSGMVTTAAKASLHTLISLGAKTPAELLAGMNNAILATAHQTLLMTCIVAVVDLATKILTIANAGHNFPYLYRSAEMKLERIEKVAGFPLGFDRDSTYEEFSTDIGNGDRLILYTDGIVECIGTTEEEYGYERMEQVLRAAIDSSPKTIRGSLIEDARRFTGSGIFADDVTTLIAAFNH